MMLRNSLMALSLGASVAACSGTTVQHYAGQTPALSLEEFFQGDLEAHGVVKDWRGRVIRKFSADILAYWDQGVGTLEEDFLFDDGEVDRRVWRFRPTGGDSYDGTAGDVVGTGKVTVAGNSAFLDYVLRIPYRDGTIDVRIDDRMYLVTPSTLLNESSLRKFGFKVGELLLVIQRRNV